MKKLFFIMSKLETHYRLKLELANRSKHVRNKHKIGIFGAFNI